MIFLSHKAPDRALVEHLSDVSCRMKQFILQGSPLKEKDLIMEIAERIGVSHDFGKYTTFFQKYLNGKIKSEESEHGFISAIFTVYLLSQLECKKLSMENENILLLAYSIVLHHHGNLEILKRDCEFEDVLGTNRVRKLQKQIDDLLAHREVIEREYKELGYNIDLQKFANECNNIFNRLTCLAFNFSDIDEPIKEYLYSIMTFLYSCLIDADKREAAKAEFVDRKELPQNLVEIYREKNFNKQDENEKDDKNEKLNLMRNEIYQRMKEKIRNVSLEKKLCTLTAPTGTGKTITSFAAAMDLRQRIIQEKKYTPRIIYSLPFTSIIDQTYDTIKKILSQVEGFQENSESYLIKHHHLADIEYKSNGQDKPLDEALLLIESWESEVVVTTFIQLLYTVLGYQNSFYKKLHNIAGSIILLDEVQNIPVEYWPLIEKALTIMAEHLHCYIILLTATKPLIFDDSKSEELIENHQEFFQQLNRTKLICDLSRKSLDEFVDEFIERYQSDRSYLIVLNTIKSSLEVYFKIKRKLEEMEIDTQHLFYLSTNIYPRERAKRIRSIKRRNIEQKKSIVVSTQVIEAGVDIDMDTIYRDLGPIDSIIQVAGRGNRNWGNSTSEVYIYNLQGKSRSYATMVYDVIHCDWTRRLLGDKKIVSESKYYELVDNFFNNVAERISQDQSNNLIGAVHSLNFDDESVHSLSDFQLIKSKEGYIDLFVMTEASQKLWDCFIEKVYKEKNPLVRKEAFLKIKKNFRSFVISVPVEYAKKYIEHEKSYFGVFKPNCDLEFYYDKTTGFRFKLDEVEDEPAWIL